MAISMEYQKEPPTNCCAHSSPTASPNLKKSPSTWLKSKLMCHETCSETRVWPCGGKKHHRHRSSGGCIMSRNGRNRRHSADFSYDPLSYALNFQSEDEFTEEKKFSSTLPASPHREKNLDDLNGGMEAVEIGTTTGTGREKAIGRLRNNIFEVRVRRVKTALQRAGLPVETRKTVVSRPERKLMGQPCKHIENRFASTFVKCLL